MTPIDRIHFPALPGRTLLSVLLVWLTLAGCAGSGDVQKLAQENEVQNQRLAALEQGAGSSIQQMAKEVKKLTEELGKAQGRITTLREQVERLTKEQAQLVTQMERSEAQSTGINRQLEKQQAINKKAFAEIQQELDSARLRMNDVDKLIRTSLASLPTKTKADKQFREAYVQLTGGELDFAAGSFAQFVEDFPKDDRVPEALYRQGQALYLSRRYEHALVPFFQVVKKHPQHKLAVESQWMLARGLEETGDLKLAREFYVQLISGDSAYKADATRRLHMINQLYPEGAVPVKEEPKTTAPEPNAEQPAAEK